MAGSGTASVSCLTSEGCWLAKRTTSTTDDVDDDDGSSSPFLGCHPPTTSAKGKKGVEETFPHDRSDLSPSAHSTTVLQCQARRDIPSIQIHLASIHSQLHYPSCPSSGACAQSQISLILPAKHQNLARGNHPMALATTAELQHRRSLQQLLFQLRLVRRDRGHSRQARVDSSLPGVRAEERIPLQIKSTGRPTSGRLRPPQLICQRWWMRAGHKQSPEELLSLRLPRLLHLR